MEKQPPTSMTNFNCFSPTNFNSSVVRAQQQQQAASMEREMEAKNDKQVIEISDDEDCDHADSALTHPFQYAAICRSNTDKLAKRQKMVLVGSSIPSSYPININSATTEAEAEAETSAAAAKRQKMVVDSSNIAASCPINNINYPQGQGMSTELKILHEDPWTVKMKLNGKKLHDHAPAFTQFVERIGVRFGVWDVDTKSMHAALAFKDWRRNPAISTSKTYVMMERWIPDFVKRRNLKKGDITGLYWDKQHLRFNFAVLSRV